VLLLFLFTTQPFVLFFPTREIGYKPPKKACGSLLSFFQLKVLYLGFVQNHVNGIGPRNGSFLSMRSQIFGLSFFRSDLEKQNNASIFPFLDLLITKPEKVEPHERTEGHGTFLILSYPYILFLLF